MMENWTKLSKIQLVEAHFFFCLEPLKYLRHYHIIPHYFHLSAKYAQTLSLNPV